MVFVKIINRTQKVDVNYCKRNFKLLTVMKNRINFLIILGLIVFLGSCGGYDPRGELVGTPNREPWYEPEPYGMVYVKEGKFNMGPSGQDVPFAMTAFTKTVSIGAFWMDETEITNDEYRQFVFWVRDSIARRVLIDNGQTDFERELDDPSGATAAGTDPLLDWDEDIEWDSEDYGSILEDELFLSKEDRFRNHRELDTRKLVYDYVWVDLKQAAKKNNRYNFAEGRYGMTDDAFVYDHVSGEDRNLKDFARNGGYDYDTRRAFIMHDTTLIYPDTLVWIADYSYSYNEPLAENYFWHPAYDNYPVVGVTWMQARAFSHWRTKFMNDYRMNNGEHYVQSYRLPTEAEWEYAARGGLKNNLYPWGGPYATNEGGCYIANFKNMRGNYVSDGSMYTVEVMAYFPNEFGLYEMAGNVSEWTSSAFDESASVFVHDLNPDYQYNARKEDPPVLKRKVIRGGSWKDVAYYMQCGSRTYEYQDSAKSYIGFRCVRSYLGNRPDGWAY